jgi:hypothetical protein
MADKYTMFGYPSENIMCIPCGRTTHEGVNMHHDFSGGFWPMRLDQPQECCWCNEEMPKGELVVVFGTFKPTKREGEGR